MSVAIFANTLSASMVFRGSLIRKLYEAGALYAVFALKRDFYPSDSLIEMPTDEADSSYAFIGDIFDLHNKDIDIIHSFTHSANIVACVIALVFRKKLVMTVTGMGRLFGVKGVSGFLCRNLIRCFYFFSQFVAQVIIVQNQDDFIEIERLVVPFSRCMIRITPGSGIPKTYFSGFSPKAETIEGKVTVGFFSRAIPQKGVWSFFELASAHVSSDHLNFIHVGLPGKGVLGVKSVGETAKKNNVSYKGYARDLRSWLLAADIVVIPSDYREGVSRLLIESMLAGKVVVAKMTSGIRDHLQDGVNGFVYESDSEFFYAFERALSALKGPIPKNAKAYAKEHFDVTLVNKVYFDAYRHCGMDI